MFNQKMKAMIKRKAIIGVASAALLGTFAPSMGYVAQAQDLEVDAEASITVDFETGQILQGKAVDEPLGIASMSKMIVEYILFEEIEAGNISWETEVSISDYAQQISQNYELSNVPLRSDDTYTIEELYEALAIYSANGATIAIAEAIAGSEPAFVDRMKETVESFGITDAYLVNSTGLNNEDLQGNIYPDSAETDENMMSARSSAILANRLLNDYPEVLEVASVPTKTFREGSSADEVEMINWNWMLPGLINERENVDGLKTGTTIFAGATFTGTAEEDGRRLITVVLNSGDDKTTRFVETDKMLDFGFEKWAKQEVTENWDTGLEYEPLAVSNGKEDTVDFEPSETLEMLVQLGDNVEENLNYSIVWNPDIVTEEGTVEAPVADGMELGELVIEYSGNELGYLDEEKVTSVPLVATEAVDKAGFFGQAWNWMVSFFDSIASRF
ncbi:MAG TPA: serine hydrolase [Atopostipes sp.]|jgi:D-alanyl-D-alanine carboxypeptidase|nr:serine hydrolase [Atopostipes sp.]